VPPGWDPEAADATIGEISFDSRNRILSAEDWFAELVERHLDDDGDELPGVRLASARLVRVGLNDARWYDSLDADSGDLEAVAAAIVDRDQVDELDPDATCAESLTVIDFIGVEASRRGDRLSHSLARSIGHIFRNDIVALVPASMSTFDDGEFGFDAKKQEGLRRHWARGGFEQIPGTDVMVLPMRER